MSRCQSFFEHRSRILYARLDRVSKSQGAGRCISQESCFVIRARGCQRCLIDGRWAAPVLQDEHEPERATAVQLGGREAREAVGVESLCMERDGAGSGP